MELKNADRKERERLIRESFDSIAERYDLLNDVLSGGLQRIWKRKLIKALAPKRGEAILDLAAGTGSIASMMAGSGADVTLLDPSEAMLGVARRRYGPSVRYCVGYGERMEFEEGAFDKIAVAFGIRNAESIGETLKECLRVLKPGGLLLCLEFSRPVPRFRPFHRFYLKRIVPNVGRLMTGRREAYQYLADSIECFHDQEALATLFKEAGFVEVRYENLTFGTVAIHSGRKSRLVR